MRNSTGGQREIGLDSEGCADLQHPTDYTPYEPALSSVKAADGSAETGGDGLGLTWWRVSA